VVAIGDLHGDLKSTREVLRVAGLIDASDRWVGGDSVLVQTGDVFDRGDDEVEIFELLERLTEEARAAGGRVVLLHGNHELMNAVGDMRYVTAGGAADFASPEDPGGMRSRVRAFAPRGSWAKRLSGLRVAVKVGDTVFVHGGVMPAYANLGLDALNKDVRCWLIEGGAMPASVGDPDGPLWSRHFSLAPENCDALGESLDALDARRMVVGHTPQLEGVTSSCDERVWRVDVGIADYYGGPSQALEIRGQTVRVLTGE
jgi:hypothetical protein